uniref:hypothetical protein n=1 Tax=Paenibacillus sp. FSL R5-0490 TaxID=1920424 RepID=UPI00403F1C88
MYYSPLSNLYLFHLAYSSTLLIQRYKLLSLLLLISYNLAFIRYPENNLSVCRMESKQHRHWNKYQCKNRPDRSMEGIYTTIPIR